MRIALQISVVVLGLACLGCEGDYQGQPGQKPVEIKETPDMSIKTDHDVEVNTPDVDVDVNRTPGQLPKVEVDVLKTPDKDTDANERNGN